MPGRAGRLLPTIFILLILCLVSVEASLAQETFTARLSTPDTSQFPHLTAYLDIHDPTGVFLHGLRLQDVSLQENELQIPASVLQEQKPGVQFVVAITSGESFAIRDPLGVSRYEYLLQGLLAGTWADQPSGGDDFSLITLGGPQLTHSPDPAALRSSLEAYLPNDSQASPTLEVLASALQVAAGPLIRPGMERAILFITPPQEDEVSLGLQSIVTSAIQQNIHIYVWLVAAREAFDLPAIDLLENLALQTHATFFAFSHDELVPDLESILEPLRYVYKIGYDSQIIHPGSQQVAAQVSAGNELITSPPASFALDLQGPVITLLNIPVEIVRSYPSQPTEEAPNVNSDLMPSVQVITIRVAYPDGHERPLTRTSLYIDGIIAAENTRPPFEQFAWDLSPYIQDGAHSVRVEAVDNLGLTGKSADISIKIILPSTTQGVLVAFSQNRPLIIGAAVLIGASILVLVLILGGRLHPKPYPGQVKHPSGIGDKLHPVVVTERRHQNRLALQPANLASRPPIRTKSRLTALLERLPWLKPKEKTAPALAHLVPLVGSDEITLPSPIQIIADDVTLGCDPLLANLVIADPSIEGLHARIHYEDKVFQITDAGSVAGTWVNFTIVPPEGIRLEHADIIHLGRVGFRIILAEPERLRKIVVTPQEPEQ